eukprot:gene33758-45209_t
MIRLNGRGIPPDAAAGCTGRGGIPRPLSRIIDRRTGTARRSFPAAFHVGECRHHDGYHSGDTALAVARPAFAAASMIDEVKSRGVLRSGLSTFVPWAMRDKTGNLIGYELDVAKRLAADLGVKDSQFNLGILAAKGVGMKQNLEESYKWFALVAKTGDKDSVQTLRLVQAALVELNAGRPARTVQVAAEDDKAWRMLQLLTSKPALYVSNVDEASAAEGNDMSRSVAERAARDGADHVAISAQIESEIAMLDPEERTEFLETLGLSEPGLNKLIREAYHLLGLQTYFTVGPKEARAWTIHKGDKAPQAAGVIHTDFERGFIRAQTIAYNDYITLGGEVAAKEAGKARDEGKEYVVQDGDVMLFRFNV